MIDKFERFLNKVRQSNGDILLPITIEKYIYFVSVYEKKFLKIIDLDELINVMNNIIKQRPSIVIYSAFRMWLLFIGIDKRGDEIRKLRPPEKRASASNSKRFLQSKVLSRGELRRLYNESDDKMRFIYSALYDTACRRKELLNIKYGDIIFRKESDTEDNIYAEINILGKGAKSRVVYFGKLTCDLLRKLRPDITKEEKLFILYQPNGNPYKNQSQALYDTIAKQTKQIIGRRMHPHCWRHTSLTHLADNGADVLGISKYAGHNSINTTMIYIEISNRLGKLTFAKYSESIISRGVEE